MTRLSWRVVPRAYGFGAGKHGWPRALSDGPLLAAAAGYSAIDVDARSLPRARAGVQWLDWIENMGLALASVFLEVTPHTADRELSELACTLRSLDDTARSIRLTLVVADHAQGVVAADSPWGDITRVCDAAREMMTDFGGEVDWHPHAVALEREGLSETLERLKARDTGVCLDCGWLSRMGPAYKKLPEQLWQTVRHIQFRDQQLDGAWAEDFRDRQKVAEYVLGRVARADIKVASVELFRERQTAVTTDLSTQAKASLLAAQEAFA